MEYAEDTKLRLIEWLLPRLKSGEAIGTEVAFCDGRFRADLVIASGSRLSGFEIKGPRDDLRKLASQCTAYLSMFLDASLVAPIAHIRMARPVVPSAMGLISITDGQIKVLRQPYKRVALRKAEAVRWLRTDELLSLLRQCGAKPSRGEDLQSLRNLVTNNVSAKQLFEAAKASLVGRLEARYTGFKSELGNELTLDDLRMLQVPTEVIWR
jgi:hypothetical protein